MSRGQTKGSDPFLGCSVLSHLEIVSAGMCEYRQLSRFHYRDHDCGPWSAMYAIIESHPYRSRFERVVGVIVYKMPVANLELRNVATGGYFDGLDRSSRLQLINKHIRCISRVIIEPRYRGLGLASWLVSETMGRVGADVVEAMAVMGKVNPFFERAGMQAYQGGRQLRCEKLIEALEAVGISQSEFVDAELVDLKIGGLSKAENGFINKQISEFLQSYGKRRNMTAGLGRTRYVLSKLTERSIYYIWFNEGVLKNGRD